MDQYKILNMIELECCFTATALVLLVLVIDNIMGWVTVYVVF